MANIEEELEKIKFHISTIGGSIDSKSSPIPHLVIRMDWAEEDLNRAHDIFKKYDDKAVNNKAVNWGELEREFEEEFGYRYSELTEIVLAFFRNGQYTQACKNFAKSNVCNAFREIVQEEEI